jgi:putative ABC transport system permease protein
MIGLVGVVAFVVDARTPEVGLRMALGATRPSIFRMIAVDALKPVALGVSVGLVFALIGARLLRVVLLGVSPFDPIAVAGAVILLAGSAVLAILPPTWRATRIDAATVLKAE